MPESRHSPLAHLPGVLNPVNHLKVVGRLVRRTPKKPGSAPGTLVHTGPRKVERIRISFLDYDAEHLHEEEVDSIRECFPLKETPTVSWINVDGLHDLELIRNLGEHFGFHPLVLEDLVSVGQRPKLEEHEDYLYIVLHMLSFDGDTKRVESEQLSLLVGSSYVFSFQERVGDVFDPVRERIRSAAGRIRGQGPDYLAYALMDAVVDGYYAVLERVGDEIEDLDLEVMEEPEQATLRRIHDLKREMLVIRRAVWPLRDVMSQLLRSDHPWITSDTKVFFRDVYDHAVQSLDTVETLRDLASGLTDLYLSAVGQRQNEVMKVLTIMASIFIPLTFVAGVYGMNFQHMPELALTWAYPAVLALMAAVAGAMTWYFRRKGWW